MAAASGLTQNAIFRIRTASGLQPHRQEAFKLSSDPLTIEKVRGIVGLYLASPFKAMVLCVVEKTQIQALDRSTSVALIRAWLMSHLDFMLISRPRRYPGLFRLNAGSARSPPISALKCLSLNAGAAERNQAVCGVLQSEPKAI